MDDIISRQAAIGAIKRAVTKEAAIWSVESLPSVQSEPCEDAEFWQKRAEYYSKICLDLIAGMYQDVKLDSIEINEEGINFKMTQPEPCEDAVSRQQALDILDEYSGEVMEIQCNSYEKARLKMCKLPPAQPEETTATAIRTQDGDVMWYICDACNEPINIKDRFCAGCGRKVRWNE